MYVTAHRPTRLSSELEEVGAVLAHGARAMISARARALRRPPAGAASPSSPAREECMPRYIGLDLHKRILEVCVLNEAGAIESRHRLVVSREALRAFAQSQLRPDDRLAVEATTNTWPVVEVLRPFVSEIVVSNPLRTKAIAEAKVKTDKVDAHTLAQLLRVDYLPAVWQPDAPTARLRQLTNQRAGLVADCTAIKNRIHAIFHQRLISVPEGGLFKVAGRKWLERVDLEADDRAALARDLHLLAELETAVADLEERLLVVGGTDPRLKLLVTMPGVNVVCAQTLLAALGELGRFRDGDHAASYLGLVPRTKQSAARTYHGPITKAGNGHARWVLVQAAQHLATHPGPLGVFFRRLAHKKNRNVAVVATARKLVVIAYELLRRGEPYRYAQPAPTAEKLRRLRLRTGGPRRTTGCPKGTQAKAKLPGGSRTHKALQTLYAEEGLPVFAPLRPGERRLQQQPAIAAFVASLAEPQTRPRRHRAVSAPARQELAGA